MREAGYYWVKKWLYMSREEETRELSRIINGDVCYGDSALASGLALMAQNKIERDEKMDKR